MATRRPLRERLTLALGMTCVLGTLVLSLPGVRVVHAGEDAFIADALDTAAESPDRCAPGEAERTAPSTAPAAPPPAPSVDPSEVIVLNTGGYNYTLPHAPIDPASLTPPAAPEAPPTD